MMNFIFKKAETSFMEEDPKANGHRPRHSKHARFDTFLHLLPSLTSGSLTMTVNKLPLLKVDSDSRSLSVEAAGVRESGLKLGEVALSRNGEKTSLGTLLSSSERLARSLAQVGWTLTVYDGNSDLLSMGRGISRMTGHVSVNPIKLMKLVRVLQESKSTTG
ncbi:MAG TPA: hypothetical protein VEC08_00285 [Nitrososphaerales archaeon]|nr:hypothetical protein [Nitrososphaerales archaeon]